MSIKPGVFKLKLSQIKPRKEMQAHFTRGCIEKCVRTHNAMQICGHDCKLSFRSKGCHIVEQQFEKNHDEQFS